ncbi:BRCT domain-containing protein, partial [Mariniphaga sediminis]|uniref:BRCT domain-containing protein n=1 Tax=Mariniphaga sediminis TaxID=1628158 RepID=UPI003563DFC1
PNLFLKSTHLDSFKRKRPKARTKLKLDNQEIVDLRFQMEQLFGVVTNKLEGKVFVVSGVFESLSRDELKKLIEDNGGKVSSSISSKTSFIIAGDNMGPSKLEKANKLGISIISEDEFLKMLDG